MQLHNEMGQSFLKDSGLSDFWDKRNKGSIKGCKHLSKQSGFLYYPHQILFYDYKNPKIIQLANHLGQGFNLFERSEEQRYLSKLHQVTSHYLLHLQSLGRNMFSEPLKQY